MRCAATGIDSFVMLFLERFGARQLEMLLAAIVVTMSISMGFMYVTANCSTAEVISGAIIPKLEYATLPLTLHGFVLVRLSYKLQPSGKRAPLP
jgi:Mn2+/Fe2+ NRAMP family transporter